MDKTEPGSRPDIPTLRKLFHPRSIAFVGASSNPEKTSGRPLVSAIKNGFDGAIWPINPNRENIAGYKCFRSIGELPGVPDVAMVLVGGTATEKAIRELAEIGTPVSVVLAGGYAEVGAEGGERQEKLKRAAGRMSILGPNTIGFVNVLDNIYLSASAALTRNTPDKGSVAIISQSGGILGSLLNRAKLQGIGLSHLVATGNEADIEVSDLIAYLLEDPRTRAIILYLETLRNPLQFRKVALQALKANKPLIVYKVGRSKAGAKSVSSHTGALAGEDELYDCLFRQTGVIRVNRYTDLLEVAQATASHKSLKGKRLAVLTSTGGAAGLVADVCGLAGFELPDPDPDTARKLGEILTDDGFVPTRNPVDITMAGVDAEIISKALTCLMESPAYDAIIPVAGSSSISRPELIVEPALKYNRPGDKPLIVYSSPGSPDLLNQLNRAGIPAFDNPESCALALGSMSQLRRSWKTQIRVKDSFTIKPQNFSEYRGQLNEAEALELLQKSGIPSVKSTLISLPLKTELLSDLSTEPKVIKILCRNLLHKSDVGGVAVNVSHSDLAGVCHDIIAETTANGVQDVEGLIVQDYIPDGLEVILGFKLVPEFGNAILVGSGGVLTELYQDFQLLLLPVTHEDVETMLDELVLARRLDGYRDKYKYDRAELIKAIVKFAALAEQIGDRLLEMEINPLLVRPQGKGVAAVDAVIRFKPE